MLLMTRSCFFLTAPPTADSEPLGGRLPSFCDCPNTLCLGHAVNNREHVVLWSLPISKCCDACYTSSPIQRATAGLSEVARAETQADTCAALPLDFPVTCSRGHQFRAILWLSGKLVKLQKYRSSFL